MSCSLRVSASSSKGSRRDHSGVQRRISALPCLPCAGRMNRWPSCTSLEEGLRFRMSEREPRARLLSYSTLRIWGLRDLGFRACGFWVRGLGFRAEG